jgi:hypothetical protein
MSSSAHSQVMRYLESIEPNARASSPCANAWSWSEGVGGFALDRARRRPMRKPAVGEVARDGGFGCASGASRMDFADEGAISLLEVSESCCNFLQHSIVYANDRTHPQRWPQTLLPSPDPS